MKNKVDDPIVKEIFGFLSCLEKEQDVNMWEASTTVKKNYPLMPIKECNDIVIEWMQSTDFYSRWKTRKR